MVKRKSMKFYKELCDELTFAEWSLGMVAAEEIRLLLNQVINLEYELSELKAQWDAIPRN